MKKSIIILSTVIVLVIGLFIANRLLGNNKVDDGKYLEEYLEKNNYKKDVVNEEEKYVNIVESDENDIENVSTEDEFNKRRDNKKSVEYIRLFYNPTDKLFEKYKLSYADDVSSNFYGSIDLSKNKKVNFQYIISIYRSSIMLEGTYELDKDNEKYDCKLDYQKDLYEDEKELKEDYCVIAKAEILSFMQDKNEFLNDFRIRDIIVK